MRTFPLINHGVQLGIAPTIGRLSHLMETHLTNYLKLKAVTSKNNSKKSDNFEAPNRLNRLSFIDDIIYNIRELAGKLFVVLIAVVVVVDD